MKFKYRNQKKNNKRINKILQINNLKMNKKKLKF